MTEASAQLLAAARRLEPLDVDLARETYLDAWGAAMFAGRSAARRQLVDVSARRQRGRTTGGSTVSVGPAAGRSRTSDH